MGILCREFPRLCSACNDSNPAQAILRWVLVTLENLTSDKAFIHKWYESELCDKFVLVEPDTEE